MAKNTKCPRCGEPARLIEIGRKFDSPEVEKRYYELEGKIEDLREGLRGAEEDPDCDPDLQDMLKERKALKKHFQLMNEAWCTWCGYQGSPTHPPQERQSTLGYFVLVYPSEPGLNVCGTIIAALDGRLLPLYEAMLRDPRAAWPQWREEPEDEYEEPLYMRLTLWDEETQSVRLVGESGDRKAWDG